MSRPKSIVKKVIEQEVISFKIPAKEKKKLMRIVKKHGLTQTKVMRELILKFIADAAEAAAKGAVTGAIEGAKGGLK